MTPAESVRPSPSVPSGVSAEGATDVPLPIARRRPDPRDTNVGLLCVSVVHRAGRVLLIREQDEPYRGEWVLPGGYPHPGEPLDRAARREVAEELDLDVEIERPLGVFEELVPGRDEVPFRRLIFAYLARPVSGSAPRASLEAIDFAWIDPRAPPAPLPAPVRAILETAAEATRSRRAQTR